MSAGANIFGGGTVQDLLEVIAVRQGAPLTPLQTALLEACAAQLWDKPACSAELFVDSVNTAQARVAALLRDYRLNHDPRDPSELSRTLLGVLFPHVPSRQWRAEPPPEDWSAPINPWCLWHANEREAASQALCDALGWSSDVLPQAWIILEEASTVPPDKLK